MKTTLKLLTLILILSLFNCGGEDKKEEKAKIRLNSPTTETKVTAPKSDEIPASQRVDLSNKGVGPITSISLDATIDQDMATHGAEVFKNMCTACHRPDKKFIGPSPANILERRSPEWIMNMILNPEGMVQNDPLAKALLIEFNGSPMANQNLSQEDARAVLEYFRTLN